MQIKKNHLLLVICFFGYQILSADASSLMQETTQISFSVEQSTVTIDAEPDDEEKFVDVGRHRIFSKAEPLTLLTRTTGQFVRLSDGSIFSAMGVTCGISKDGGQTWTEYPMLDPEKFSMAGPVSVRTRKGTIIVGFSNWKERTEFSMDKTTIVLNPTPKLPTYIVYSKDNGKTWSEPVKLHDDWTGANRRMLETKDGHIVFSTMIIRNNRARHCVLTYVSSDDGATWKASNVLDSPSSAGDHSGLMEADVIRLNDGRLWMLIRTNWDYFYESYSSDNGLTWSAYQKTDIDASSSPGALIRLESGRIVLVWNRLYHKGKNEVRRLGGEALGDSGREIGEVPASYQRDELSLMYSDDDGKTWSSPFVIAKNITPAVRWWVDGISYPHLFEPSKGVIWIITDQGGLRIAIKEEDLPR